MQQENSSSSRWRDFSMRHESWHKPQEWQCEMAHSLKGQGWAKDLFFVHSDHETGCSTDAYMAMDEEDMKDIAALAKQSDTLVRKIFGLLDKRMIMGDYEIRVFYFKRHLFMVGAMKACVAKVVAGKLGQLTVIPRDRYDKKQYVECRLYLMALNAFLLHKGHFFFHFYNAISDKQEAGSTTLGVVKIIGPDDTVTPPPDRVQMVKDLRKYLPENGLYQDVCFRFISQHDGCCIKTVQYPLWKDVTEVE